MSEHLSADSIERTRRITENKHDSSWDGIIDTVREKAQNTKPASSVGATMDKKEQIKGKYTAIVEGVLGNNPLTPPVEKINRVKEKQREKEKKAKDTTGEK